MKSALAIIDIALLAAGAAVWLLGKASQRDALKQAGLVLLGLWALLDIALIILAFALGWFA